jgi:hypothetical protein
MTAFKSELICFPVSDPNMADFLPSCIH